MAVKNNLPPFVIFQDPSLADMSIQYPCTLDELQNIIGVGQGKAQRYGKPFVELIKSTLKTMELSAPRILWCGRLPTNQKIKVFIIQNIDRKLPLDEIAASKIWTWIPC